MVNEKPADFCVNGMSEKWKRNQQLIDFDFIPTDISQSIVDQYLKEKDQRPGQLLNYFITKRLKYLMENMEDFIK